jgi:hypothetical protein
MPDPASHFRPLCPVHHILMAVGLESTAPLILPTNWDPLEGHDCECPEPGCPQHYSPGFGHFVLEENKEHSSATGLSALRINRSPTQAICGRHKHAMFLAACRHAANLWIFRCPQEDCTRSIEIPANAASAYWFGDGYFKNRDVPD